MKNAFLLYDSRYQGDPDVAVCFMWCDTVKEARENAPDFGDNVVIVRAEILNGKIINETIVEVCQ